MLRHLDSVRRSRPSPTGMILALIVLTAIALRLYNLDWDRGTYLHPDELHMANTVTLQIVFDWPPNLDNLLDPAHSRLNPRSIEPDSGKHHNYAYGALPLLVTDLTASALTKLTGTDWSAYYGHIHKVGRFLSALVDTLTVVLVFLIGRRLFSPGTGLAAAALYATAPIPIQLSHYFTTDTWMTCFTTLALLCAVRAAQGGELKWFALFGAAFGLAMASKASVPMLLAVLTTAAAIDVARRLRDGESTGYAVAAIPERIFVFGLSALLAFGLFEPYALADLKVYLGQLREQSLIVRGQLDVPFTRQYVGTTPVVYQVEQLVRWGLGPVAGVLFLGGGIALAIVAFRTRNPGIIVLTSWIIGQGLIVAIPETKFLRYTAPLLPALAVGAGYLLVRAAGSVRSRAGRLPAMAALGGVLLGVLLWTTSFMSVYASTNPRIEASQWIYQNVPNGSRLTAESWDLALPIAFAPGLTAADRQLELVSLNLHQDRAPNIVAGDIYDALSTADYVVMSSNRAQAAVTRAPWRYPVQIRYYDLLEQGQLGFTLVGDFHNSPGIGSLTFDDQHADESFINYDHPHVLIYQKTNFVDRETYDALMAPAENATYSPTRNAPPDDLMLDQPVGQQPVVADGRWSEALTGRTLPALVVWVLLLILLQAIGAPIAARLFPRFPDLGWGLARLVTTLIAGYLVWILASFEVISFRAIWAAAAVLLTASVAMLIARGSDLRARLRKRRSAILGAEIAFWSVFALFLAYRFINPDSWHPLWGGEKPMEFAHINAILRSAHFPPYDPWYADGYINYYYYGSYLTAFLIKLTGIPSEISFNLAQPTMIALIASAGYSVAAAIARDLTGNRTRALGGFIGAGFLVAIGNLDSAIRFFRALPDGVAPDFYGWTWAASRAITGGITEFPYFTGLYADLHAHVVAWPMTLLAIALCYSIAQQPRLLTIALSQSPARPVAIKVLTARLAMLALVLGSLFATNAWDVPVYAALAVVAIFMATGNLPQLSIRFAVTIASALATAVTGVVLFQPFLSHYVTLFGSLERTRTRTDIGQFGIHLGVFLTIIAVGLVALSLRRGLARPAAAYADPYVIAAVGAGLAAIALTGPGRNLTWIPLVVVVLGIALLAGSSLNRLALMESGIERTGVGLIVLAGTGAALLLTLADRMVLAVGIAFAAAGIVLWVIGKSTAIRFTGALIAAGASIVAGAELVFLADDLAPDPVWYRMNTIFKFYNQVWTLLALSAAVILTSMVQRLHRTTAQSPLGIIDHGGYPATDRPVEQAPTDVDNKFEDERKVIGELVERRWLQAGVLVSVILISAALLYPLLSTRPRLELRFPGHPSIGTLNALDWMRYGTIERPDRGGTIDFSGDLAAIRWFNETVDGTPVIAEASIGPYRGNGSRFSIATGLPTILGWDRHERQQRYPEGIDARWADVRTLYDSSSPDVKLQILRKYDVRYVIVGDVERYSYIGSQPYASAEGIATFDELVGRGLEVAFQSGATTVYRVVAPGQGT